MAYVNEDGIDRTTSHMVWMMKLSSQYWSIRSKLMDKSGRLDGKLLQTPQFRIFRRKNLWGQWDPKTRTISLHEDLFLRYEPGAVEFVLKHEMAHQIVEEIWDFRFKGHVHGEAFKKACKLLDIPSDRCTPENMLIGFKGSSEAPVVDKVRKLLVKGNDKAASQAESETFIKKAHELMARHSIDMHDICGEDRLYLPRPVGPSFTRYPDWASSLSYIAEKYYGVKRIIDNRWDPEQGKTVQFITLFGTPDKLDIAEYVLNAILNTGDILYRDYLKQRKNEQDKRIQEWRENLKEYNRKIALDPLNAPRFAPSKPTRFSKASKSQFMSGLLAGYSSVLYKKHKDLIERLEKETGNNNAVLALDDPILKEAYHKQWPNLRTRHGSSGWRSGAGYHEGQQAGQNMRIRNGVASGAIGKRNLIGA